MGRARTNGRGGSGSGRIGGLLVVCAGLLGFVECDHQQSVPCADSPVPWSAGAEAHITVILDEDVQCEAVTGLDADGSLFLDWKAESGVTVRAIAGWTFEDGSQQRGYDPSTTPAPVLFVVEHADAGARQLRIDAWDPLELSLTALP